MIRIFIGYDDRETAAYHVLSHSILSRASCPVSITPLNRKNMAWFRRPRGEFDSTDFAISRFLVPYLCHYEGWALFVDSDTICTTDVNEILTYADPKYAVIGVDTDPAFERAAVMLFNCGHPDNEKLTPEYIETAEHLLGFGWTERAGKLPKDWNFLIGYDAEPYAIDNGDVPPLPRILHYTMGVPVWPQTANCPYADVWHAERRAMCGVTTYDDLMGKSVHKPNFEAAE